MQALGIDIGGSGIKGAPVDVANGKLLTDRHRIKTPQPATPQAVAEVVARIVDHFSWDGPVGCALPSVVRRGVVETAANIDDAWIGTDGQALFAAAVGRPVALLNDADAAGLAEMAFGAGKGRQGLVIALTFGTGIGSGMFYDGRLIPNTEFGHLEFKGMIAEQYCAGRLHEDGAMSFDEWGARVNQYLHHLERVFSADLMIIGGGISKNFDEFAHQFDTRTGVVPAAMRNQAGIAGAAMAAAQPAA